MFVALRRLDDLRGLRDRGLARLGRRQRVRRPEAGVIARGEHRRHQLDRHLRAALRDRRVDFSRRQARGLHARCGADVIADERA